MNFANGEKTTTWLLLYSSTFRFFRCVVFCCTFTYHRYTSQDTLPLSHGYPLTHKPKQQARRSCSAIKRVGKGSLCISVDFLPKSFEKMSTFSLFKARRGKQRFSVVAKNKHAEEGEEENREEGEMIENIYYQLQHVLVLVLVLVCGKVKISNQEKMIHLFFWIFSMKSLMSIYLNDGYLRLSFVAIIVNL